jgi:hypothetical protein
MAYAVPKQWAHGDTVSHTNMQKYSDSLNAIYAKSGDAKINPAVLWSYEQWDPANFENSFYTFVHKQRYLWFKSTGAIVDPVRDADPAGVAGEDDVSLSENQDNYGVYDLETIGWLTYGSIYYVTGVSATWEYDWLTGVSLLMWEYT